jgi:hypothetical protein
MAEERAQRRLAAILAAECSRVQPAHGSGRGRDAREAEGATA